MLDGPRAGPDRPLRALGAMGVDSDEGVVVGRLLDGGPELVLGELRGAPGTPPRVRTAPVPMHLIRSAPPMSSRRTRSRTSSTVVTTPNRRSSGSRMSLGQADDVAAAPRRGDERPGALHPRADDVAAIDRVAQGAVGERPERPEVADAS